MIELNPFIGALGSTDSTGTTSSTGGAHLKSNAASHGLGLRMTQVVAFFGQMNSLPKIAGILMNFGLYSGYFRIFSAFLVHLWSNPLRIRWYRGKSDCDGSCVPE
jgi:hypothetical protein